MTLRAVTIPAVFSLMLACTTQDPIVLNNCVYNSDCAAGQACNSGACLTLCNDSSDCIGACVAGVCSESNNDTSGDTREVSGAPELNAVTGNGSVSCTGANQERCFTDGLIVSGRNLTNAAFTLGGLGVAAATLADGSLELSLPTELNAGQYVLVAMNAAGSDQLSVNILQGEQGPQGIAGPAGTQGPAGPQGIAGPAGDPGQLVTDIAPSHIPVWDGSMLVGTQLRASDDGRFSVRGEPQPGVAFAVNGHFRANNMQAGHSVHPGGQPLRRVHEFHHPFEHPPVVVVSTMAPNIMCNVIETTQVDFDTACFCGSPSNPWGPCPYTTEIMWIAMDP